MKEKDSLIRKLQAQVFRQKRNASLQTTLRDSEMTDSQPKKKQINYRKLYDFKLEENRLLAHELITLRSELNQVEVGGSASHFGSVAKMNAGRDSVTLDEVIGGVAPF